MAELESDAALTRFFFSSIPPLVLSGLCYPCISFFFIAQSIGLSIILLPILFHPTLAFARRDTERRESPELSSSSPDLRPSSPRARKI